MSTSTKQERTIYVLLPNKDQLDITVGVSFYFDICSFHFNLVRVLLIATVFWLCCIVLAHRIMDVEYSLISLCTCSSQSPRAWMFLIGWQSFLESKSCISLASQW